MGAGIADINYSTTSGCYYRCTANAATCNINTAVCAVPTWTITTGEIIESRNWPCKLRFIIWSSSGCNGRCGFWCCGCFRSSGYFFRCGRGGCFFHDWFRFNCFGRFRCGSGFLPVSGCFYRFIRNGCHFRLCRGSRFFSSCGFPIFYRPRIFRCRCGGCFLCGFFRSGFYNVKRFFCRCGGCRCFFGCRCSGGRSRCSCTSCLLRLPNFCLNLLRFCISYNAVRIGCIIFMVVMFIHC